MVGKIVKIFVERDQGSKYSNVRAIYAFTEADRRLIDPKAKLIDTSSASRPAPVDVASAGTANPNIQVTGAESSAQSGGTVSTTPQPPAAAPAPSSAPNPNPPRNIPF